MNENNPPKAGFQPILHPDVDINECLGWAQINGDYVRLAAKRARNLISATNETLFCIVYGYVKDKRLEPQRIIQNGDFFHQIGFHNEPFNVDNWRGRGILVDYGDIVPPLGCPGFYEPTYSLVRGWAKKKILKLREQGFL